MGPPAWRANFARSSIWSAVLPSRLSLLKSRRTYAELECLFRDSTADTGFFIVLGVQGGGKTSESLGPSAIFLDAALRTR